MKKIILGLFLFAGIATGAYAGEKNTVHTTTPKVVTVDKSSVKKASVPKIKKQTCATQSNSAWGECWIMTATVTHCCDCEYAVASMIASLSASKMVKENIWILEVLEEVAPC